MKGCGKCKDYRDCSGHFYSVDIPDTKSKEYIHWYHYGEIRFCPYQVIFIIENSETLLIGNWPPNPEGSSYIDPNIVTGYRNEAYYVKPELILGEVGYRLERVAKDAREALLDEVIENNITNIKLLSRPARRALMYVKGKRRKRQSYSQWMAEGRRLGNP